MRLISTCLLLAFACLGQSADDTAIRAIVSQYLEGRDRQDSKAVAAIFTADADQLVSTGEWRKGRDELVKGTLASTGLGNAKRTLTIENIRYLTPAIAIADARYEIESSTAKRKLWSTIVLSRSGRTWKIAAIRNMQPSAN